MDAASLDHGVLITSDPYSNKIADDDRDVSLLFGDASTATYFSRSGSGYRLVDSNFGTVPDSYRCLVFREYLEMNGGAVFKHAVKAVPPGLRELLSRNDLDVSNIDLFLLHQASKYLVEYLARKMGAEPQKVPFEAREYGNTVSSSIPLMLQKHVDSAALDRILLSGFGVGFTWGNKHTGKSWGSAMTAVEDIVRLIKEAGIARGHTDALIPDQSLADQGFDSYDRMSLLSELEDHFSIELSDEAASHLRTLDDIVTFLNSDDAKSVNPSIENSYVE